MKRSVGIAALLVIFVAGAVHDIARHPIPLLGMTDLSDFYCAGKIVLLGENPYLAEPLRSCEHSLRKGGDWNDPGYIVPAPQPPYDFAPYAVLSLVDFGAAKVLTALSILIATLVTALALSRLGIPIVASLASLALSDAFIGIFQGQVYPFVVMLAALCAVALERRRDAIAGALAALTLVEPQLGVPICIVVFIWAARARIAMLATLVALVVLGTALVGSDDAWQWATQVIPLHALWQVHFWAQYSLTYVLAAAGVPARVALVAGTASALTMLGLSVWLARQLSERYDTRAFLVFVPAAFALVGGTFVHLEAISAAIPMALLLVARANAGSSGWAALAVVLLAIPETFAQEWKSLFFPAMLAIALICIGYRFSWSRTLAYVVFGAVGLWLLALHTPPPIVTIHQTMPTATDLASHQTLVTAINTVREAAKVPTWLGLIALLGAALSAANRKSHAMKTTMNAASW